MGDRFYQVLRELGQSTYDLKRRDKQEHTAPGLGTHYAAISAEINEVKPEVLAELKNPLPINEELSTPPNNDEAMREFKKMKDSAAGPDEITAGMMRWACTISKFRRHFCSAIRSLWVSPPCQWLEMLHQATIVSLWKRK